MTSIPATLTHQLPGRPERLLPRWEDLASCAEIETSAFFSDDLDEIVQAKRLCLSCPVRTDCLDAAVERKEQYGIWGGHLFNAGRIVLHKRRRGRPPKVARPEDSIPHVEVPEPYRRLIRSSAGAPIPSC